MSSHEARPTPIGTVTLTASGTPSHPALTLRPWADGDVAAVVEAHRDPALRRWTTSAPEDHAAGRAWVAYHRDGWAAGDRFAFAVFEDVAAAAPRLVGHMALRDVSPGAPSAEVGYWTMVEARGHGVAHRALETVTTWAFDTFAPDGLQRLRLLHQVDNAASCRVAQKAGYALDGVLAPSPPHYPLAGHRHVRAS